MSTPPPPVKVFHDWEFLEDGRTILPISVGMVTEGGTTFYRVFNHHSALDWERIRQHPWLHDNVLPHLPVRLNPYHLAPVYPLNRHPDRDALVDALRIPGEIEEWLTGVSGGRTVELWGYYSAYDHVALAQQFGPMINRPAVMPMWTNDLQQVLATHPNAKAIEEAADLNRYTQGLPEHHALSDARWDRDVYKILNGMGFLSRGVR